MILAVTGHRPPKAGLDWDMCGLVSQWVYEQIKEVLLKEKPDKTLFGAALGVDLIFARCCIDLGIKSDACIPCFGQSLVWPKKSQEIYQSIINNSLVTKVPVYSNSTGLYDHKCMQNRNEYMVNNSDKVLAIFDGSSGGTANCVRYAKQQGKELIVINPNDF